ncbi:MAG: tyrosine-type recombinase/integrase [Chitinophagaceae bacterium]
MKNPTDFSKYLSDFLGNYLPNERGVSINTIKSYSHTFILLLTYLNDVKNIRIEKVAFKHFTRPLVVDFLDWLQAERGCSNTTRNQRLSAISSFIKFAAYKVPDSLHENQQILSIPLKKTEKHTISYLTTEGMKLILKQPDISKTKGMRDLALLSLMYESAARVQELIDLTPSSLFVNSKPYRVELHGKGNKYRTVPLPESEVQILLRYMDQYGLLKRENAQKPLFHNAWGQKMTRNAINNVLVKHAASARSENESLITKGISCHGLRHSKVMGLLDANVQLIHIRDFLGHKSVLTTEIYARVNPKYTFEAIKAAYKNITVDEIPLWESNTQIISMLKGFTK